jgi:hypothetical protein
MRWFTCGACHHTVYFENVRCTHCGHSLAFLSDTQRVSAMEQVHGDDPAHFMALTGGADKPRYRLCANGSEYGVCNWAIPVTDPSPLCVCCRLNDVIPDLSKPANMAAWKLLEAAKRRLLYTLGALDLPIESRQQRGNGLVFNFKEDGPKASDKVFTGHNDGEIVINVSEADDPFREKLRKQMGEGYRTVLGHFRHEIGHYYWDRLIKDTALIPAYRALFGDEQASYEEALEHHYTSGPPKDWPSHYISSYATMHPWEDWAESWAHYLHMMDTLETAGGLGMVLRPQAIDGDRPKAVSFRSLHIQDFDALMKAWVPLTLAHNSLNRSMGLIDSYPFILSDDALEKLRFVHDVVKHAQAGEVVQRKVAARWNERLRTVAATA